LTISSAQVVNFANAPTVAGGAIVSTATPTVLGTVYAKQTTGGGTPYLTAFGYNAGVSTTGVSTTAIGTEALYNNTTGTAVTAVGYQSVYTSTCSYTTAIGYQAGFKCSDVAYGQIFVGYQAGYNSTSATKNTIVGVSAGYSNVTGNDNTYNGYNAGYYQTGGLNTAVGSLALIGASGTSTASYNTAVGYQALYANTTGRNTGIGAYALATNTTGTQNSAFGDSALYLNTTGSYNTAVGYTALTSNTTGANNTAIGWQAFYKCTTPNAGTAVGYQAGFNRTTAPNTTAFGYQALYNETTANGTGWNTALGNGALSGCTVGYYNLAVGGNAGNTVVDGAANIFIGTFAAASATNVQYENVLGGLTGKGNNTLYVAGSSGAYNQANSSSWSTTSDRRLKKNIVDNTIGLDAINAIQVRNFEYRTEDEITELPKHAVIKKEGVQIGAIAQELQQVLPDCVKTESTGVMSVDTTNITWHLINAVKELSAELNALKAKVGA